MATFYMRFSWHTIICPNSYQSRLGIMIYPHHANGGDAVMAMKYNATVILFYMLTFENE